MALCERSTAYGRIVLPRVIAEFVEVYFATAKIGGVVVPLNWRLVADELEFILKDSGSLFLVYGNEFSSLAKELHSRGDKTVLQKWFCCFTTNSNYVVQNDEINTIFISLP